MIAPGSVVRRAFADRVRRSLAAAGDGVGPRALAFVTWWPARQRVGAAAVLVALVTAAAAAATAGTPTPGPVVLRGAPALGVAVYVGTVVLALFVPGAIAAQVGVGILLASGLLLAGAVPAIALLPVVAGIVATAELLGVAARLDTPGERAAGGEVRRAAAAAGMAAAVYAVVLLVGGVRGPGGLLAVALASTACAGVALLLLRRS